MENKIKGPIHGECTANATAADLSVADEQSELDGRRVDPGELDHAVAHAACQFHPARVPPLPSAFQTSQLLGLGAGRSDVLPEPAGHRVDVIVGLALGVRVVPAIAESSSTPVISKDCQKPSGAAKPGPADQPVDFTVAQPVEVLGQGRQRHRPGHKHERMLLLR